MPWSRPGTTDRSRDHEARDLGLPDDGPRAERRRRLTELSVAHRGGLIVAALIGLCALGTIGLAAQGRVDLADQSFDQIALVLATLVAIGFGFAILVIAYAGAGGGKIPINRPRRANPIARMLAIAVMLLLVWWLAAHRGSLTKNLFGGHPKQASPNPDGTGTDRHGGHATHWNWTATLITALILIALIGVLVALIVASRAAAHRAEPEPDVADEVLQAVTAGRVALDDEGDPRTAVMRAYAAMEGTLASAGVGRRRTDTPAELLARAGAAGLLGTAAVAAAAELTTLFRLARYSRHDLPLDAAHRARSAFATIEGDLRVSASASDATSAAGGAA